MDDEKFHHGILMLGIVILLSLITSACAMESSQDILAYRSSFRELSGRDNDSIDLNRLIERRPEAYPIDSIFLDFYRELGGEQILGPVISPVTASGTKLQQYVEAGLLIYDRDTSVDKRYYLASLGRSLRLEAQNVGDYKLQGRLVNRYQVYDEFLSLYQRLGGIRIVGQPISGLRHNPEKQRIEQYFENLGFYRLDKDVPGEVHLLAYGAYICDRRCRYQPPSAAIPVAQSETLKLLMDKANQLGAKFTGRVLSRIYLTSDNLEGIIFENIVLMSDGNQSFFAYPIVRELGFDRQPFVKQKIDPLMVFYSIDGEYGHNIPEYFYDYIEKHGGISIAGDPISEVDSPAHGIYQQCFENLCLEYDLNVSLEKRLGLIPLGMKFKELVYDKGFNFRASLALENVSLRIWEEKPFISSSEFQIIHVYVTEKNSPKVDMEPVIYISLPDGNQELGQFPPTDEFGYTAINIPPIDAPNGTLIPYRVCLKNSDGESKCNWDNYLIWNTD